MGGAAGEVELLNRMAKVFRNLVLKREAGVTLASWRFSMFWIASPPILSPSEQRPLGGKARTQGDHHAPVSAPGVRGLEELVQDEQDSRRGHVSVLAEDGAGRRERAIR